MRKAAKMFSVFALAMAGVVFAATMALADSTYPPSPPPPSFTVPPPPTASTGANLSTPLLVMGALVIVGVIAIIAAMVFTKPAD